VELTRFICSGERESRRDFRREEREEEAVVEERGTEAKGVVSS